MSSVVIALLAGIGAAAYVWSYLSRTTGSARPTNIFVGAGIAGLLVFLVLLSFLKWVLNI